MTCSITPQMWERRTGNFGKRLIFGLATQGTLVALSAITDPQIRFRLRSQPRTEAVTGQGTLSAYTDTENDPPLYNTQYAWHADDPDYPGVYVVELEGTDGSGSVQFPDGGTPWLIRITEDVG
jgi:hypothetical protein